MLCPPFAPLPIAEDWLRRHSRPVCFVFHVLGVPPTVIAVLIAPIVLATGSLGLAALSTALFVGGYVLQFLGHWLEGTEPGEVTVFKKVMARRRARRQAAATVGDMLSAGSRGRLASRS